MQLKDISRIFKKHFGDSLSRYFIEKIDKEKSTSEFLNAPFSIEQKVMSSIIMSSNIRYGDFIEEVIREFLKENGMKVSTKKKNYDLYFENKGKIYVGEIKMRDNHDSTKKRGQIENLIEKCQKVKERSNNSYVFAALIFIDDSEIKNLNYYVSELKQATENNKIDDYKVFYGDEFFKKFRLNEKWNKLKNLISKHNAKLKERNQIIGSVEKNIRKYDKDGEKRKNELKIIRNILEKYRV